MARPEKPIDWELVDQLIMAGCNGPQIAPHFNISVNYFYDRFKEQFSEGFQQYSSYKKEHGKAHIILRQYNKALKGDNQMLLHVGKHLVGQKDHEEKSLVPNDTTIDINHELITSKYENMQKDLRIKQLEEELSGFKPKTDHLIQSSDQTI